MKLRKLHKKRIRVVKIDNRNIVNQLLDIINNGGNIWKRYLY